MNEVPDEQRSLPIWLSEWVEPVDSIRHRRESSERVGLQEHFQRWLHAHHSFGAGLGIMAWLYLPPVLASIAYGLSSNISTEQASQLSQLAGSLGSVAGALANISAILFAVAVFGLQFHGESLGKAAFLTRYLGRREGLVPLAAVTLAAVGANATVSVIATHQLPAAAVPMAYADYLMIPLVLLVILWIFYRMVVSVAGDFFQNDLLPALSWEYMRATDEQIYIDNLTAAYHKLLNRLGVEYARFGRFDKPVDATVIPVMARGEMVDIKVPFFEYLIRSLKAGGGSILTDARPGGEADASAVWVARKSSGGLLDPWILQNCRALTAEAFMCRRASGSDLRDVLKRFTETLVAQAAHDHADQLARALEVCEQLIGLHLARRDAPAVSSLGLLSDIVYMKMGKVAVDSGDVAKVGVMLTFCSRMLLLAQRHRNTDVLSIFGRVIDAIYWHSARRSELAGVVGERVDDILGTLLFAFHRFEDASGDEIRDELPLIPALLQTVLHLIKTAIDLNRAEDAASFHHRLFQWDEHREVRLNARYATVPVSEEVRAVLDLHFLAEVVIAGWCVYTCFRSPDQCVAAARVLQHTAGVFEDQQEALDVWLRHDADGLIEDRLSDTFRVNFWRDELKKRRTLVFTTESGEEEWLQDGLYAALLAKASRPAQTDLLPITSMILPDDRYLRGRLQEILEHGCIRTALGVGEDKQGTAVDGVCTSFERYRRRMTLEELRKVTLAEISAHRAEIERDAVVEGFGSASRLVSTLKVLGADAPGNMALCRPLVAEVLAPKTLFLEDTQGVRQIGASLIREFVHSEDSVLTETAATVAASLGKAASRQDIRDLLTRACDALRASGFTPNAVFVPRVERILEAVFGTPPRAARPDREIHGHLGMVESLHVLSTHHQHPREIVVLDVNAFWGVNGEESRGQLALMVEDRFRDSHLADLQRAKSAPDAAIPSPAGVRVVVIGTLSSELAVRNPTAALRIDLDLRAVGYAVQLPGVYHRATCPRLVGAQPTAYCLTAVRRQKQPCDICRPQEWIVLS